MDAPLASWRVEWSGRVRTPEEMVAFLNDVGLALSQELPQYPELPNQRDVLGAGARDVWFWKDDLHADKQLYYTRAIGGHTGFVSMELLPAMVASCGRVVDELEMMGQLSVETKQVFRAIEEQGPISSKLLKPLLTPDAQRTMERSLVQLERHFIVTKCGISGRTRGTYSYIWELVERWAPEMLEAADALGGSAAARQIRELLSEYSIPADSVFYRKVLGWTD